MKQIIYFIITGCMLMLYSDLRAQEEWTLEKCIKYALDNNIQIKQQQLSTKYNKNVYQQSVAAVLPSVSANASEGFSFGWSVDPFTNEFSPNNTQSTNLSLQASVTLFNGLQTVNTIQQNKLSLMASYQDLEKLKNDISLNIAAAYLQILYSEELFIIAKNQAEITRLTVERTQKLVDAGSLPKGNLLEVQAQLASEELSVVNAENQTRSSYLTLTQLLDLDSVANFKIVNPQLTDPSADFIFNSVDQIYNQAMGLPQIKSAEYKYMSSKKSLAVARGRISPRLTVMGQISTGYSSIRKKYEYLPGDPKTIGWVDGTMTPVYTMGMKTNELDYAFNDQINDNLSKYVSINLQIPLFNNLYTRTAISNSKINVENTSFQLEVAKNNLYKDIQQAYNDAQAARAKFIATQKTVSAMEESFNYTQQKFDVGLVTSIDYNTAKNRLTKSKADLLQAKYEFVFKINVLNFYSGAPIKFE